MKLIQRLGTLFTAIIVVSCSKKEPEVKYSWAEDSEAKLETVSYSSDSVATVFTVQATVAQGSGHIESAIGMVSSTDIANGISITRDFTDGNFNASVTTDGLFGEGYQNNSSNKAGIVRYQIDLGRLQSIAKVNTYSGGGAVDAVFRGAQKFALYGSAVEGTDFDETDTSTWYLIAKVSFGGRRVVHGGSSINGINAEYRRLLWVADVVGGENQEGTVFKEFDVFAQ